jgi:hypothetical protein
VSVVEAVALDLVPPAVLCDYLPQFAVVEQCPPVAVGALTPLG